MCNTFSTLKLKPRKNRRAVCYPEQNTPTNHLSISPSPSLNLVISLSQSKAIYFHTNTLFLPLKSASFSVSLSVSLSQGMSRLTCMFSLWVFLFVNLLFLCIVWFWVLIQVGFDPEINLILGFDQFIYLINLYFSVITRMLVWLCLSFGFFIRMLVFCDY